MSTSSLALNQRALKLCRTLVAEADALQITPHVLSGGTTVLDLSRASQSAGILLARVCLADLAQFELLPRTPWPLVEVTTAYPLAACLASQYAGWEIKSPSQSSTRGVQSPGSMADGQRTGSTGEHFFAMGSGPMRAAAAREPLYENLGYQEQPLACVGVLETDQLPSDGICHEIAAACGIRPSALTLLIAPTNSTAGTLQVVARSVETVLHKLHELGFELTRITHGTGTAPLPPVASESLSAMGRTNDAILYGGQVSLTVRGDDASLKQLGPQLPSSASAAFGRPFAEILASNDHNFYQVDPLLFSAAQITFQNQDTGNTFEFGTPHHELLQQSFGDDPPR